MSLNLPPRCWRRRDDCEPLAAVDAAPDGITEDQFLEFDYDPFSFVCCGCVAPENRVIPQDAYRICWKNPQVDEMGEYDEQDITHQMLVMSQALAVVATRRVNGGMVEVPSKVVNGGGLPPWKRGEAADDGQGPGADVPGSGAGLPS